MNPRFWLLVLSFAVAPATAQVPAGGGEQMKAPNCPADAEPIPAPLASWKSRKPFAAAVDKKTLDQGWLAPGIAVDMQLSPTPKVSYVKRPAHPGGSVSYGGMLAFHTDHAGTVRVAIGSGAWISVIDDKGAELESIGHGHGPNCSGIHKMVDFQLQPGGYVIEIAGNGEPVLPIIVAPLS